MALVKPVAPITRPIGERPAGLGVARVGDVLRITFAWRSFDRVVIALASATYLVTVPALCGFSPEYVIRLLTIPAAIVGVAFAWVSAAGLLNETRIEVTAMELHVTHGPIPWPGNLRVNLKDVLQLYVRGRLLSPRWGGVARLMAAMESGEHIPLTRVLFGEQIAFAAFIEKQIETHAGIVNRPILCSQCGYDLRGSPKRCPECGTRVRSTKRQRSAWTSRRG